MVFSVNERQQIQPLNLNQEVICAFSVTFKNYKDFLLYFIKNLADLKYP